jgi:hypothetical protein
MHNPTASRKAKSGSAAPVAPDVDGGANSRVAR